MKRVTRISSGLLAIALIIGAIGVLSGCDDDATAEVVGNGAAAELGAAFGESQLQMSGMAEEKSTAVEDAIAIETLIENPGGYEGREVLVRGVILTQCIRGCQFTLDDDTGVIGIELVDEALENVLTSGSVGRTVMLRGTLDEGSRPVILVSTPDGWWYVD